MNKNSNSVSGAKKPEGKARRLIRILKEDGFGVALYKLKGRIQRNKDASNGPAFFDKEQLLKEENTVFPKGIKYSVLVPLFNTPKDFLTQMIDSVKAQSYKNWELCLADGSDEEHSYVKAIADEYAKNDGRIKYKKLLKNKGISENTNECIKMATGNYLALFDHDDLLHPSVLFEYAKAICEKNADLLYCDEDKFETPEKGFYDAYYKPDFAVDDLRANNYICHFTVFKRELLNKAGLLRSEFDGSQDHDLILRLTENAQCIVHIPKVLYHWRVSKASVAWNPYAKPYTIEAGKKAVFEHLKRCGIAAKVESSRAHPNIYRIRYELTSRPLVSIIINAGTKKAAEELLKSVKDNAEYENYEIIALYENRGSDIRGNAVFKDVSHLKNKSVPSLLNYGASLAKGEQLLFLNGAKHVFSKGFISELLMFALRKDVGAAGAMLLNPGNTVNSAGMILGINGTAGDAFSGVPAGYSGYFGKCAYQRDVFAVSSGCMMIKKSAFIEAGGFDEAYKEALFDADICLKLEDKGYITVWTPYAKICVLKKTKAVNGEDAERFKEKWRERIIAGDRYYNPNLSLRHTDFRVKDNCER